jgi:DNA-binding Lrp family transcriptional regulator
MKRIAMRQEERDWLEWLKRARDGVITQRKAAEKMGVSERWAHELLRRMAERGDAVVVHGLRGRPSNRGIGKDTEQRAIEALKDPEWHDFGPTFASEQLAKRHGIVASKETVRRWMIEAGLWQSRSRVVKDVHVWRSRRSSYGELVQWDTSDHDWLEGRGEPVKHLVRLIDDATSRSWGRFVWRDATRENMGVLWEYLERNGRMADVYTDRDSMFAVPRKPHESEQDRKRTDRLTQIGRALRELGIGWIAAFSPQAKGRVERSFQTDQDRMIKQLRLAKVTTMSQANEFLEKEYWPEWNERFAKPVSGIADVHRPLTPPTDLAASLSHVEHPMIYNDYTFSFAGQKYQIVREAVVAGMRRQRIRVEVRLDGSIHARFEGSYVSIKECLAGAQILPAVRKTSVRKDHNAGGKSRWMRDFWNQQQAPPLWRAIRESNAGS